MGSFFGRLGGVWKLYVIEFSLQQVQVLQWLLSRIYSGKL